MNFDTKASKIILVIFQMKVIFQQNVFFQHIYVHLNEKLVGVIIIKRARKGEEKYSKLNKYLCITIKNHGNHNKLLLFCSYECQKIQTKNPFNKILSLSFNFRLLNTYSIRRNQVCKGLLK
jgi:hypothetical protein